MQRFLESLSVVTNAYALAAFLVLVVAWLLIALRIRRNRQLLNALEKLPPGQRLKALQAEMGHVSPPRGLSPQQWLKLQSRRLYVNTGVATLGIVAIALLAAYVVGHENHTPDDAPPSPIVNPQPAHTAKEPSTASTSPRTPVAIVPPPTPSSSTSQTKNAGRKPAPSTSTTDSPGDAGPTQTNQAPSVLRVMVNRPCDLTFDNESETQSLEADTWGSFNVDAGSYSLSCEDGAYSASTDVEIGPGEEKRVQLTLELSDDARFVQHVFATLRGKWTAVWTKEKTPFPRCSLRIRSESTLDFTQFDDRRGVIVAKWESNAPIEATFETPANPSQVEIWTADFDRGRCKDSDQWRNWLDTKVPLTSEGRAVLGRVDRFGLELTISKCKAHSLDECGSDMIGSNAEHVYLTKQGYIPSKFTVEVVSKNVFKVGDLVFHRQ